MEHRAFDKVCLHRISATVHVTPQRTVYAVGMVCRTVLPWLSVALILSPTPLAAWSFLGFRIVVVKVFSRPR